MLNLRPSLIAFALSQAVAPPALEGSVVDPTFSAALSPNLHQIDRFEGLTPLNDGGVAVALFKYGGVGGTTTYFRLASSGAQAGAFGSRPGWTDSVQAVLGDGTLATDRPPHLRTSDGAPLAIHSTPAGLDPAHPVSWIHPLPDGRLLFFQGGRIVRTDADGRSDPTFNYTPLTEPDYHAARVDSRGRLLLMFSEGESKTIARYLPNGPSDTTFRPIRAPVARFWLLADDSLLIATKTPNDIGSLAYTHHDASGEHAEPWDLGRWSANADAVAITPDATAYIGYSGLGIFRVGAGPNSRLDPDFYATTSGSIGALAWREDRLYVAGNFLAWEGHATAYVARLDTTQRGPAEPPKVQAEASPRRIEGGNPLWIQGRAIGRGPLQFEWRSLDGGTLPSDPSSPQLHFESFSQANVGRYQLRVTSPYGTTLSPIVDLRPTQSSRLINLSGRARVGSGEAAVIAGFVVESASPEPITRLMLRGVGPALSSFGVDGYAIDPQLTLHNDRGDAIASNDNWEDTPYTRHLTKEAGAFPLAPASNDSLLLHEFPRGLYSLQMRAKSAEGEGVALAEIYQLTPFPSFPPVPDELTNLSLRGRAGKGPDALIAGFVVRDPHELGRPLRLLIRAIGPTLAQFGIQSPVADPRLTVFDAAGRPLAANDDWAEGAAAAEIAAAGQRRGAFPLEPDSRDAALLIELPPGAYSIHATPTTGTGGIGLIELYRLSD